MKKNNWLANCIGQNNKNKYQTEAGNGHAIPQHKEIKTPIQLPDGNWIIITKTEQKFDENGQRVMKDLSSDIQDMKESVDFERILKANMNLDQIQLAIAENKEKFVPTTPEYNGDFSDFATVEKLQSIKNNANRNGKNYNDFTAKTNQIFANFNKLNNELIKLKQEAQEINKIKKYSEKSQK